MLSVDYGASFESLGHSLSIDSGSDGVYIPPVPIEILDAEGLPDCYGNWARCAGRVDWTTFVDFTNVAAAGAELGWQTLFYGPQSQLEQISRRNLTVDGETFNVPGYAVLARSRPSRHVQNWYGRETLASQNDTAGWQQRWTSFKTLLLEKPDAGASRLSSVVVFQSWHLDHAEVDACWGMDAATLPVADWIRLHPAEDPRDSLAELTDDINDGLGRKYAEAYEEAQLAVQLVDWLVAAEGCGNLKQRWAQAQLDSQGLWQGLRGRLVRAWASVWGEEAVERVAAAVLERLARPTTQRGEPFECAGVAAYRALCEDPGDGWRTRTKTH